jgi:MFS transporter, DHA2 family, multidrug resistance protein
MPERAWAVLALSLGVFLSSLDASIANVALPTISRRLGISPVDAIWIVNSYQLGLISYMLVSSAIGEIFGYRRLFLKRVTLFTLASLGCALAPTWIVLIGARVIQGMGAAFMLGIANALLRYGIDADSEIGDWPSAGLEFCEHLCKFRFWEFRHTDSLMQAHRQL